MTKKQRVALVEQDLIAWSNATMKLVHYSVRRDCINDALSTQSARQRKYNSEHGETL